MRVYTELERKDAIDEEEAEHGKKEHDEGYETLLPLLEATELYDEDFSENLHEFSETLLHHLDEEERDILNPAREDVSEQDRARIGAAWLAERNRMLEEGCGSTRAGARARREVLKASWPTPARCVTGTSAASGRPTSSRSWARSSPSWRSRHRSTRSPALRRTSV